MQSKNTMYVKRWFNQNFILITYKNKSYDKKLYPKLVLSRFKVMGGLTFIYAQVRLHTD
jgi:hypothetical protein